jgi:methionyl-tRNA synthetase
MERCAVCLVLRLLAISLIYKGMGSFEKEKIVGTLLKDESTKLHFIGKDNIVFHCFDFFLRCSKVTAIIYCQITYQQMKVSEFRRSQAFNQN